MSYTIPDRAQINRNNSRHSTGPRTRSCLSAFRHGLTGQMVLMPAEDLEAYQHHIRSFVDEYQPQGATETQLVQALADAAWRINRVSVLETNLLTYDIVYEDFPNNESTHEMREAMAISAALDSHARALSTLSLHGQRLSRQFEKTLALLQQLQSTRFVNEVHEHAADGFVFSNEEIEARPARDDRAERATEAEIYRTEAAGTYAAESPASNGGGHPVPAPQTEPRQSWRGDHVSDFSAA